MTSLDYEEGPDQDPPTRGDLIAALQDLVTRCDGKEGVRADGSNIDTLRAHTLLDRL